MKLITWNVYRGNKKIPEAIEFLKKTDADVICLQEFPAQDIAQLEDLGMNLAVGVEFLSFKNPKKRDVELFMVIASKHPIEKHVTIEHKNYYEHVSSPDKRYKDFKADSFFVEVTVEDRKYRIFNAHFKCVAGPYHRLSQFDEVINNLSDDVDNIICGDFNSFGKPFINLFVWKYFGYHWQEIKVNEYTIFNTLFSIHGFHNPFKNWRTFVKFPIQLDYILLPAEFKVIKKKRLGNCGSDHFPLYLELGAKTSGD